MPTVEILEPVQRAYEGLGNILTLAAQMPQAMDTYQDMVQFSVSHGDVGMQVSALNKLASVSALSLGQFAEAEAYLAQAEELAQEYDEVGGIAESSILRCQMCTAQADFDAVIRYMGNLIDAGHKLGARNIWPWGWNTCP